MEGWGKGLAAETVERRSYALWLKRRRDTERGRGRGGGGGVERRERVEVRLGDRW